MSEEKKEVTNSPIKSSESIKTDELKTSDQKSVSIEKIDEKIFLCVRPFVGPAFGVRRMCKT